MITTQIQPEPPMTFEQIWAMLQETDRIVKETAQSQKETDRIVKETAQSQKETDRIVKETAQQMKETDREVKETVRTVKEVSQQLGGMGNSNGSFAENYFANSLKEKMMFAGLEFDEIEVNMKGRQGALRDEFDTVMYNGNAVAIFEVKYRAQPGDLEKMVKSKVSNFRTLFPYYADHKVYLGIGSLSFTDAVIAKAHELGIGILRQKGETIEEEGGPVRAY
ncbi:hypothetical protein FACS189445_3950 [Spirochaetia bacterium]|nr:hypothetical protein FACS189445_3950 [Spirochaetia bacterium]